MLLGWPWHVLHFTGHGDFDPDKDEGVLALTDIGHVCPRSLPEGHSGRERQSSFRLPLVFVEG
jgi:hypothetical protein